MDNFFPGPIKPFQFWCQKTLPAVYSDELSYYELLCKVVALVNEIASSQNELGSDFNQLSQQFQQLKDYVDNYFKNLDVQEEINNKIDQLVLDGTFDRIFEKIIDGKLVVINDKIDKVNSDLTNKINGVDTKLSNQITALEKEVNFVFIDTNAMKASSLLKAGNIVRTQYFLESNKLGGAYYRIGTTSAGTGSVAVANNLYANLIIQDTMDVCQFGADPTATNDSSRIFQTALDNCHHVIVPNGTYYVTAIQIPNDRVMEGYGKAELRSQAALGNYILVNKSDGTKGGYEAGSNITLKNLFFNGISGQDAQTLTAFGHCTNILIDHCHYNNVKQFHFIEINSSRDVIIKDCYFEDYGGINEPNMSEMIQIDGAYNAGVFPWFGPYDNTNCTDIKILNNVFINRLPLVENLTRPAAIGNHTLPPSGDHNFVLIEGNYCQGLQSFFDAVSMNTVQFLNNFINFNNCGIYIHDRVTNIAIKNNYLYGGQNWNNTGISHGIFVVNSQDVVIDNNRVTGWGRHGITFSINIGTVSRNTTMFNGCNGIEMGKDIHGMLISENSSYSNDQIKGNHNDLYIQFTKVNLGTSLGDLIMSNNKISKVTVATESFNNIEEFILVQDNYFKNSNTTFPNISGKVISSNNAINGKMPLLPISEQHADITAQAVPGSQEYVFAKITLEPGTYILCMTTRKQNFKGRGYINVGGFGFENRQSFSVDYSGTNYNYYFNISGVAQVTGSQPGDLYASIWTDTPFTMDNYGYLRAFRIG